MTKVFCVRCRKIVKMKKAKIVTLKNGKNAKKGICSECGGNVCKIVKRQGPIAFIMNWLGLDSDS
jgi:hypothetical protein